MVMIVDNAVAAEPLVICRLVVKMDAMDKSGDPPTVVFTSVESRSHERLELIG